MSLATEKKKEIITSFHKHNKDTGSPEVQVALLTGRINALQGHLKNNVKDTHSRYGLIKMVGQRKRLLEYLRRNDTEAYQKIIARLDLRK